MLTASRDYQINAGALLEDFKGKPIPFSGGERMLENTWSQVLSIKQNPTILFTMWTVYTPTDSFRYYTDFVTRFAAIKEMR